MRYGEILGRWLFTLCRATLIIATAPSTPCLIKQEVRKMAKNYKKMWTDTRKWIKALRMDAAASRSKTDKAYVLALDAVLQHMKFEEESS